MNRKLIVAVSLVAGACTPAGPGAYDQEIADVFLARVIPYGLAEAIVENCDGLDADVAAFTTTPADIGNDLRTRFPANDVDATIAQVLSGDNLGQAIEGYLAEREVETGSQDALCAFGASELESGGPIGAFLTEV
ncbi:MAG: DUF5333 family protein [Pseudomonadota bacterium]